MNAIKVDYIEPMSEIATLAALGAFAVAVAKPVVTTGCKLIEDLLGEPCKIAGALLSDQVYCWQWMNRARIAARAKAIMEKNGIAARVIDRGFLLPLVDAAGNIENPELQESWAKLLASGVKSDEYQHPAFTETLKQLTVDEARIVSVMARGQNFPVISVDRKHTVERCGKQCEVVSWVLRHFSLLPFEAECERTQLGPAYLENICRLGIAKIPSGGIGGEVATMTKDMYPPVESHPIIIELASKIDATSGEHSQISRQVIRVTTFGRLFMEACATGKADLGTKHAK